MLGKFIAFFEWKYKVSLVFLGHLKEEIIEAARNN